MQTRGIQLESDINTSLEKKLSSSTDLERGNLLNYDPDSQSYQRCQKGSGQLASAITNYHQSYYSDSFFKFVPHIAVLQVPTNPQKRSIPPLEEFLELCSSEY